MPESIAILLGDDAPGNMRSHEAALRRRGFELVCALPPGEASPLLTPFDQSNARSRVEVFCELHCRRRNFEGLHQAFLLNAMGEGYAHCRMLYAEDGRAMDFVCLETNPAFERLTGLTATAGRRIGELAPAMRDTNPEIFEVCDRVAASGAPELFETHVKNLYRWFEVHVYSTAPGYFTAVFRDISARKQAERELLAEKEHLAHEVSRRTTELSALAAHIQQIAEDERARVARELHDELGSTLVALGMEIGRMQHRVSEPALAQDLKGARDLVGEATRIMRSVVSQLYPTILDNYGIVAAIEWQAREFGKHSGIAVELELPRETLDMEQAYALAAFRIVQECLTNIAKHAQASRVRMELKADGGFLYLAVCDDGKGLPAERKGGHGIFGMTERARHLGGSLDVTCGDGCGTKVRLRLPLASPKPPARKRVLVVDDHAIVRDALKQLLESQTDDFAVEGESADGKSAVRLAADEEWDIVLLDISMPKKSGLKVLEEIIRAKPGLPVVMLSSHGQDEYGEIALAKGASGYVEKGETARLVETMRRAILTH